MFSEEEDEGELVNKSCELALFLLLTPFPHHTRQKQGEGFYFRLRVAQIYSGSVDHINVSFRFGFVHTLEY